MHLVETTTVDEPTLDEPTLDEPTLDEPDLHHGSKMDKAEEFTILPGTDGGIFLSSSFFSFYGSLRLCSAYGLKLFGNYTFPIHLVISSANSPEFAFETILINVF